MHVFIGNIGDRLNLMNKSHLCSRRFFKLFDTKIMSANMQPPPKILLGAHQLPNRGYVGKGTDDERMFSLFERSVYNLVAVQAPRSARLFPCQ